MVTRNIKAKTATQVNANLIGVQVRPDSGTTVNGITVRYYTRIMSLTGYVGYQDKDSSYRPEESGLSCVMGYDENENYYEVYYQDGTTETIEGVVYNRFSNVPYGNKNVWLSEYGRVGDYFANLVWDETEQAYIPSSTTIQYYSDLSLNMQVIRVGNNVYMDTANNFYDVFPVVNSELIVFTDNNGGFGMSNGTSGGYNNYYFSRTTQRVKYDGVYYYYWDGIGSGFPVYDGAQSGVGSIAKWDDINVGDTVSCRLGFDYTATVKSVDTEDWVDPINCTLSYSVDGSTWTDWPENMTDDNNVISNIPRYMYLKFSQDVVITEE